MKRILLIGITLSIIATLAHPALISTFSYQSFKGRYLIYGGGLGDPYTPTSKNKRIAYWIKGYAAQQMFNAISPDLRNVCGADGEQRIRQRAEIVCMSHMRDGYSCNFGFDLQSGRSIGGSIC